MPVELATNRATGQVYCGIGSLKRCRAVLESSLLIG